MHSLVIAGASTVPAMFLGTICAYSLARFRTGGEHLGNWIMSQRMVPPITVVFPIFLLYVWLRWVDTYLGIILLYTAFNLPYVIWMMRGYIMDIPRALEEAALVDGCTRWQVIWKVVVPLSRAGLFATAIFTFVFAWNEFLFALVLTRTEVTTYTVQVTHYFGPVDQRLLGEDLGHVGARHAADLRRRRLRATVSRPRNLAGGSEGVSPRSPEALDEGDRRGSCRQALRHHATGRPRPRADGRPAVGGGSTAASCATSP